VSFSGAAAEDARYESGNSLSVGVPAMPAGSYDVLVVNPDGTKAMLRKGLTLTQGTAAHCASTTVYFGFDSTILSPEMRVQIDQVAACVREGGARLRVEGHCDDRGTTEYNLALGQRRADAIERYVLSLGVSPTRLRAVSYGEERPVRQGTDADVLAVNRRGEIVVEE
jgi:peptidoglycan-associated lipoprotein